MNNRAKVLFVDDEPRVLLALHRTLSGEFEIDLAGGPNEGMTAIAKRGPFAVVVSDLKMPGCDGIDFLSRVKEQSPETVRVMLTGQGNLESAIAAVNEGSVFRFLTKPCPANLLERVLRDSVRQHQLTIAERQLLHRTLMGSVGLVVEMLGLVCPETGARSLRISHYVNLLADASGLENSWQVRVAGLLSQIGKIALAPGASGAQLQRRCSRESDAQDHNHPRAGARLLARIERLETVAEMVALQQKAFRDYDPADQDVHQQLASLGGQILHVAIGLDELISCGVPFPDAVRAMSERTGEFDPELLLMLTRAGIPDAEELRSQHEPPPGPGWEGRMLLANEG